MPTLCPSTEGQSQAWGCLAETQFPIRTAKSLSFSLPQGRCTAQSSAPHLHQPSLYLSAQSGPTPGAPATIPQALTCAPYPSSSTPEAPELHLPSRSSASACLWLVWSVWPD